MKELFLLAPKLSMYTFSKNLSNDPRNTNYGYVHPNRSTGTQEKLHFGLLSITTMSKLSSIYLNTMLVPRFLSDLKLFYKGPLKRAMLRLLDTWSRLGKLISKPLRVDVSREQLFNTPLEKAMLR